MQNSTLFLKQQSGQHLEERHCIKKDRQMRILEHYLEVKNKETKKNHKKKQKTKNKEPKKTRKLHSKIIGRNSKNTIKLRLLQNTT